MNDTLNKLQTLFPHLPIEVNEINKNDIIFKIDSSKGIFEVLVKNEQYEIHNLQDKEKNIESLENEQDMLKKIGHMIYSI